MDKSSLESIYQYRAINESLATSGQPSVEQIESIAKSEFSVIVNLALHDDPRYSLADEPGLVWSLGLEYFHIPVQFAAPTESDLLRFFAAMDENQGRKIWVHCAANIRVSAFLGLYRVIRLGWEREPAFALMHELWQPDAVWSAFIAAMLSRHASRSF